MTPQQKRQYLTDKQNGLWSAAEISEQNGDELGASKSRVEAAKLQDQLDGIQDPAAAAITKKTVARVSVDSIQAVGGGGGIGSGSTDPALRKMDETNNTLRLILGALEMTGTRPPPRRAPLP